MVLFSLNIARPDRQVGPALLPRQYFRSRDRQAFRGGNSAAPGNRFVKGGEKMSDPKNTGGFGLQLPLIVRFPDVLKHRLASLQSALDTETGYGSHYQGFYPVKCNQNRYIVEDVVKFGCPLKFGLEAGPKAELLLAMSCLCKGGHPESLLICNGFKDVEYIGLALMAKKLALNTIIVLEKEDELDLLIELSRKLGILPVIGLRAKLRTKHSGHFGSTSGEKGKFGLTTTQILGVVKKLENACMLDCLQLLHFHIGSQIPTTMLLADVVTEGAHIYCERVRLGAKMSCIDIGGGLGIDYDGSKSCDSDMSVEYSLREYASTVVSAVQSVCNRKGIANPVLCSESGRAIVSHHSVLVFEVVSASSPCISPSIPSLGLDYLVGWLSEEGRADYSSFSAAAMRGEYESGWVYADRLKQRCIELFKEGCLGIEQLGAVDGLCDLVAEELNVLDSVRTYNVNLCDFTSIPDFWGFGQVFPIVPIHRLDEKPGVRGILSDLTCDSDGKIDRFIGGESSLPLQEIGGGGGYYLGMFLGGAYEEALGGLRNLFGGPSVVRVLQCDGPHSFAVTRAVQGPSCGDVLRAMQHEPQLMLQTLKHRAEECLIHESDTAAAIANGLARSFSNMPYLLPGPATTASCGFLNINAGFNGYSYYYDADDGCNAGPGEDEP